MLCTITTSNGKSWHLLFLYGASQLQQRNALCNVLQCLLQNYESYLIIGDINQLESYADKLGGSPIIRGWEEITTWKHSQNLQDVPFFGRRFTWANNRENHGLIMERLDWAYASPNWLTHFPNTISRHFPFTTSDHAPILLHTDLPTTAAFRPYQIEAWCLSFPKVKIIVLDSLTMYIAGSPMYALSRKLDVIRSKLRSWCLDRHLFWGIIWNSISKKLSNMSLEVANLSHGIRLAGQQRELINSATLTFSYWIQHTKNIHAKFGDVPSSFFFRRLRPRKQQNHIFMLRGDDGTWIDSPDCY